MEDSISLKDIFNILLSYKWILLICNIVIIILSFFLVYFMKPTYESRGSILVNISIKDKESSTNQAYVLVKTIDSYSKTNKVLQELIDSISLDTKVSSFYEDYLLETEIDNYIIYFKCTSKDKEENRLIVNKLIDIIKNEEEYFNSLYNDNITLNDIDIIEYSNYYYKLKTNKLLYMFMINIILMIVVTVLIFIYSFYRNTFDTKYLLERYFISKNILDSKDESKYTFTDFYNTIINYKTIYIVLNNNTIISNYLNILKDNYNYKYQDNYYYNGNAKVVLTKEEDLPTLALPNILETSLIYISNYKYESKSSLNNIVDISKLIKVYPILV